MDFKSNLRDYYNKDAGFRNVRPPNEWKITRREQFLELVKSENKTTLLDKF
jgi:hypothetical protein